MFPIKRKNFLRWIQNATILVMWSTLKINADKLDIALRGSLYSSLLNISTIKSSTTSKAGKNMKKTATKYQKNCQNLDLYDGWNPKVFKKKRWVAKAVSIVVVELRLTKFHVCDFCLEFLFTISDNQYQFTVILCNSFWNSEKRNLSIFKRKLFCEVWGE